MGIKHVREMVTPEKAAAYLEHNKNNRPVRRSRVQRYALLIQAGRWKASHQGIAFDEAGTLVDGQQRLEAIVLCGIGVEMLVTTGLPKDSYKSFDSGASRNDHDRLCYAGHGIVGFRAAACNRTMLHAAAGLVGTKGRTDGTGCFIEDDFLDHYAKHAKSIEFALQNLKSTRGLYNGAVLAAIARAYYHYSDNRARLTEFIDAYSTGIIVGAKDAAASKLRTFALSQRRYDVGEIYGKTSAAIQAFMEGHDLERLNAAKEELFSVPGDRKWKQLAEERKAFLRVGIEKEGSKLKKSDLAVAV